MNKNELIAAMSEISGLSKKGRVMIVMERYL